MSLKDTATGYGWISIALHWLTFVSIVALLYLGSSIGAYEGEERMRMLNLHTSVGVVSYAILWARVIWRFVYGHPGPTDEQRGFAFYVGKWTHLAMVGVLTMQLLSGPLTAFFMGNGLVVFDWFTIPSPFEERLAVGTAMHRVHTWGAILLFIGILLHIGGVYKHLAFNQDGTFMKILVPPRRDPAQKESP